ncbi:MAG: hypothetical protein JST04_16485 [Bdellovibrionales bacterium]|nr:hypothetical protein [Bdellovibrionales bacterium]
MKKILMLSLFALAGSLSAHAMEPSEICKIMADNYQTSSANECLGLTKGGDFWQPNAVDVCGTMAKNYQYSTAMDCLRAIKNKGFAPAAVSICQQSANNYQYSSAVSCLQTAGYDFPNSPQQGGCNIQRLRNQVNGAIANYYSGNQQAMINTLNNMKNELDRCD